MQGLHPLNPMNNVLILMDVSVMVIVFSMADVVLFLME
jgi:hypothetical protein